VRKVSPDDGSQLTNLIEVLVVAAFSLILSFGPDRWPTTWPMFAVIHAGFFWGREGRPVAHTTLGVHPNDSGGTQLSDLLAESELGNLPPGLSGFIVHDETVVRVHSEAGGVLKGEAMQVKGLALPGTLLHRLSTIAGPTTPRE
jgi:hypothetical protein